jgi:acyl carrier protein
MRSEFRNDQGASGLLEQIKSVLRDSLQLGSRVDAFTADTRLLGSLPEFDSMAVVAVLTLIEERFGVMIDDDDISADTFETVGTLAAYVQEKVDS